MKKLSSVEDILLSNNPKFYKVTRFKEMLLKKVDAIRTKLLTETLFP